MKLVTNTGLLGKRWNDFKAVRMITEAGFDAFDFSMDDKEHAIRGDDYLDHAKKVRYVAKECGIPCVQAHSPFGRIGSAEDFEQFIALHTRAMEMCHVLECDLLVVHPGNDYSARENYEYLYEKLLPTAERLGVRMATENMWNYRDETKTLTYPTACGSVEDFAAQIDMANSPYLVGCLDLGHAEMTDAPGAAALIRGLGKDRIACLHVHDNDLVHDSHTLPFSGKINWESVIEALREIDYEGHFTYEAGGFYKRYPDELIPTALSHMERVGRYLIKRLTE